VLLGATWVVALIWFVLVLISVCALMLPPVVLLCAASYCAFAWSALCSLYYIRVFFGAVVVVPLVDSASCLNNNFWVHCLCARSSESLTLVEVKEWRQLSAIGHAWSWESKLTEEWVGTCLHGSNACRYSRRWLTRSIASSVGVSGL